MFWTLFEPDWYLTLELISRKNSDPVSQTCSDTRLAATSSDFPWVKTKVLSPSDKLFCYFSFLQNSPLMAAPGNHVMLFLIMLQVCQAREGDQQMEWVWDAWHCQGAESKGWTMTEDEPGAEGDPSTGRTMLSLSSANSHGAQVGPGWWHWQMSLAAQWPLSRCRRKSQDQAKSPQQVRPSKGRTGGEKTCSMAETELTPGFWPFGQWLWGYKSKVRLDRAFKGCWYTWGPDSCSDVGQALT